MYLYKVWPVRLSPRYIPTISSERYHAAPFHKRCACDRNPLWPGIHDCHLLSAPKNSETRSNRGANETIISFCLARNYNWEKVVDVIIIALAHTVPCTTKPSHSTLALSDIHSTASHVAASCRVECQLVVKLYRCAHNDTFNW